MPYVLKLFNNNNYFSESSQEMLEALTHVICRSDWKITVNDKEVLAIEDPGVHMCLKKLALLDKTNTDFKLGEAISECIQEETVRICC